MADIKIYNQEKSIEYLLDTVVNLTRILAEHEEIINKYEERLNTLEHDCKWKG